jgi:sugar-specific transcriptional regulator TrmB
MYEKELQNLGLSEKEARVYLAALELGPETVQKIAQRAGINRPTAYVQIESLKRRGLMSQFEKGKKTFYVAESPERLLSLLNAFEKELEFKKAETERILPSLLSLFAGAGERPKVRFLEGVAGLKTIQQEFLKSKEKKIYGFTNLDELFKLMSDIDDYSRNRYESGIESMMIYTRKDGPLGNASDPAKLRVAKFVEYQKLPLKADITIFDDKVALASYREKPVGIIIQNVEIAETLRALFKFIWELI